MSFIYRTGRWLVNENIRRISFIVIFIIVAVAGGRLTHLYDVSKKPKVVVNQSIVEGDNALNIGRYAEAERIFSVEFKGNSKNKEAEWGVKIAQLRQSLLMPTFKADLDALYQEDPNDAYVNFFMGEYYAANQQSDTAILYYDRALAINSKLAEAHFKLAELYEQQGLLEATTVELLKAIDSAPITKYRNKLGTLYFKQKRYEVAIKEYGKNQGYPLSALESAMIYWRLEYLSQALSYQKQALNLLENEVVMSKPENQEPWYFEIQPKKVISFNELNQKIAYAYYGLSVSFYLQGDAVRAENAVQKSPELRSTQQFDLKLLLAADLDALAKANAGFVDQVEAYKLRFLQSLNNEEVESKP
jgi:tetratricopeptide (TPR) repeat protein